MLHFPSWFASAPTGSARSSRSPLASTHPSHGRWPEGSHLGCTGIAHLYGPAAALAAAQTPGLLVLCHLCLGRTLVHVIPVYWSATDALLRWNYYVFRGPATFLESLRHYADSHDKQTVICLPRQLCRTHHFSNVSLHFLEIQC